MKILLDLVKIKDRLQGERIERVGRMMERLMAEGAGRGQQGVRLGDSVEEYRGEPRLLFEIVVQWFMKMVRKSREFGGYVRRVREVQWLESINYRAYRSQKIYLRHVTFHYNSGLALGRDPQPPTQPHLPLERALTPRPLPQHKQILQEPLQR